MTKASIIIITYNSAEFIGRCLRSVKHVKGVEHCETIVWDNASSDSTILKIKKQFPDILIHTSEKNLGFAAAVNRAAELANSKYIVLLNPDTVVDPNWLQPLLRSFKVHPNVGAVNAKTKISIDGQDFIQNAGNYVFHDGHSRDRGAVITKDRQQLYENDSEYYAKETELAAFSGVSVAIDRKIFLELGGFDEHMFMYYEDTDFSLRLLKAGYSIWYQPKSELNHVHSASSEEWSSFFVYQTELNRLLFLWKHFPLGTVLTETFKYKLSALYQLIKLKKRFFTRVKVLVQLTRNLPYLLRYRITGKI